MSVSRHLKSYFFLENPILRQTNFGAVEEIDLGLLPSGAAHSLASASVPKNSILLFLSNSFRVLHSSSVPQNKKRAIFR